MEDNMEQTNIFRGSTLNVSPLCQGCDLIEFADEHNIMFHKCEICQNEYQKMEYKEQIEWDYMAHTDIRS
jgi:hypothetical protein